MLTGIETVKGIGPKKAALMHEMGIYTFEDMLGHYPVSYEDRSVITPLSDVHEGETYYVTGIAVKVVKNFAYGRQGKMVRVLIEDDTEKLEIVFFNAGYYGNSFTEGEQYNFYGKVIRGRSGLQMVHPEFEKSGPTFESTILPVYSVTKGVTQKDMRKTASAALECDISIEETLPQHIIKKSNICSREFALKNIHFPKDKKAFSEAKYRIIFEELFLMQTGLFMKGNARCREENGIAFPHDSFADEFASSLSFEMTDAQKRVLNEIVNDMESPVPMQRLVQGDVGSGKTAVAAAALYKAAKNGRQGVMMAPTELLARQHYETFREFFDGTGIRTGFLSSGVKAAEKKETLEKIADGSLDVIIGTHAVIQESVHFCDLGIVITDEQHRFGVDQRVKLASKGVNPDILVMTATPIPRTLAVIIFGDLDISAIDELPPGRKPVKTKAVPSRSRKKVYDFAAGLIEQGQQVYVVAPLISDSESVDAVSAESLYEELCVKYKNYRVGLVHGGMKQADKDDVMNRFSAHELDILVSTVVIEVGINVPNATVMIIENAERFGLAQLHQLRGRVGRGRDQSFCFLVTDPKSELGKERAKVIEETNDGFEIAEKDLNMRGPGDFFGTRQHGLPSLGMADLARHVGILNSLRPLVKEMLQEDPQLKKAENQPVAKGVEKLFASLDNLGI
jgi:ATP-dependent DNA helicase RecG